MSDEEFNIGDRVAYYVKGERIIGTVVNIDKYGLYEIEFDDKYGLYEIEFDDKRLFKLNNR